MLFYVDWQYVFVLYLSYSYKLWEVTLHSDHIHWVVLALAICTNRPGRGIFPWPFGCVPPAAEEGQRALAYTHSLVQFLGSFINRTTALWLGWKKNKTFSWLRSNKNLWFYSEENNKLFWTHLASSCAADGNKSEWSFPWKWNNICFWNRYYCILYVDFV